MSSQKAPKRSLAGPWWQGQRGEWYVVIQFVLFGLIAFGPEHLPGLPLWFGPGLQISRMVGLAMGLIGGWLVLGGLLYLGRNLTPFPHPLEDAALVQRGVYAWVRHPIYSGILFLSLAWALLNGSSARLLYAGILFGFFLLKTRREEARLLEKFPAYADYQRRVARLIPYLF